MFPFLFNWSQSKASVVNQMSNIFFLWSSKEFFCYIKKVVSTLINVVKLDIENKNIVSTLSYVVNTNNEIDNVNLTLFNVVNLNDNMQNFVSTLIWHSPASQRHITLATTLRQRWKVSWVLTNEYIILCICVCVWAYGCLYIYI